MDIERIKVIAFDLIASVSRSRNQEDAQLTAMYINGITDFVLDLADIEEAEKETAQ